MSSTSDRIFKLLRSLVGALLTPGKTTQPKGTAPRTKPSNSRSGTRSTSGSGTGVGTTGLSSPYPGDFSGTSTVSYAPKPDGAADPGEIVWTWVPYEEDHSQGKDRPVLIVGRSGKRLLALMLTSKDHSSDHRGDNDYIDIGTGPWDRQGRPSEVKLDRILQVSPGDLRREGAVLDAQRFAFVASGLRSRHGWK
ncbi:type II toxin-antitoxin system PemK/MazF family toxin [Arthrobacter sp. TWP1-1]|uniref:type II toxin-antitoxin system PemK/MazF family toxin n=1 Tax=Arthrobacter sp. TWP1-1 TaxID=2804568 RepID=UPI003CF93999